MILKLSVGVPQPSLPEAIGETKATRPPRSGLQDLLGQGPQMPSLNQYMEALGGLIPQTLLARFKEKVNSRQRTFSPLVTFWAFLAQVLERGSSCRDGLQRVSAWWQVHSPGQSSPSSDTSGYCQARARLDERVLQQIGTQVAEQLERQLTNQQLWLGRRVKIVDGTCLSMPDTAANQSASPASSAYSSSGKLTAIQCLLVGMENLIEDWNKV
jgi:hypothetical protein